MAPENLTKSAPGVPNLEAQLLSAGVHRGGLAHSWGPSDEGGVAQWPASIALSLSLAPKISAVPHVFRSVAAKEMCRCYVFSFGSVSHSSL